MTPEEQLAAIRERAAKLRPLAMKNPNMAMGGLRNIGELKERYSFAKGFPTRENCNPADPREAFLWMFAGLPGPNGAPLLFTIPMLMMWSEHLTECGAMAKCPECGHVAEPVKKYRPPTGNEPNWATSPGSWVRRDTPDPPPEPAVEKALEPLGLQQKAELFRALRQHLSPSQKRELLCTEVDVQEAQELIGLLQEVIDDDATESTAT